MKNIGNTIKNKLAKALRTKNNSIKYAKAEELSAAKSAKYNKMVFLANMSHMTDAICIQE